MSAHLLARKQSHFVLWRPALVEPPPRLVIGQLQPGNPPSFVERQRLELQQSPLAPDLWELAVADCGLTAGQVYHYWYEVGDSSPYKVTGTRLLCTDPTAWTVDWRLLAPRLDPPYGEDDRDPAGVVKFSGGRLIPCDPGGETIDWDGDPSADRLPPNNRLVIYELPTSWARREELEAGVALTVGTFRDVVALIDDTLASNPFSGVPRLVCGRGHLKVLGINALELLPPADSFVDREWGYATSNYFAADYDLGFPRRHLSPTAETDLGSVIATCHRHGIRFFADMVMAFATHYAYQNINFPDFHVQPDSGDPEEYAGGKRRDGFGGDLFKYNFRTTGYDPVSGTTGERVPARRLMQTHLARWLSDFRIDGIRMDSIENIANWDFVQEFKDHARGLWRQRWRDQTLPGTPDSRFLVVGEELAVPLELLTQNRLDALWNEHFKRMLRHAILGQNDDQEASFEWTVRKLIDCRLLGFSDCAQAINYVTSHDVGGFRNERLYNFLLNNGINDTEPRIKLAFACLLTAVGIPMIFAGEEFADQHDLPVRHPQKQVDPVNFDRSADPWRRRILNHVARLIKLRTENAALSVNDTRFIHVDFTAGKRVLVWQRGPLHCDQSVVVVANFSDYGTPDPRRPEAEYRVPSWPATPPGRHWREVTQNREVPPAWVGREPIYPWEAKVYTLV